jgi:hypothetical protein
MKYFFQWVGMPLDWQLSQEHHSNGNDSHLYANIRVKPANTRHGAASQQPLA